MTKTTLPLFLLILSTALHAGNARDEGFYDPLNCHFGLVSRQRRFAQITLRPRSKPTSVPVKLLQPTGARRFGTGLVVELNTGQKVTAFSNATSATPEMIWQHLQQKYRGQTLRPLWWGEVEIQKQERDDGPGRIVRAVALPVALKQYPRHPQTENNVDHLVAALTAIQPNLVDPAEVKKSPVVPPNQPQVQLAPFITRRRAITEVLNPMQGILLGCLKDRNEYPTTTRQFLDAFTTRTQTFAGFKDKFSSVLQGLENDGLIVAEKRFELEALFLDMLSTDPRPNRYLGDALHGELSALQEKMHYVATNPHEHVEIIEPGTIIPVSSSDSPPGQ